MTEFCIVIYWLAFGMLAYTLVGYCLILLLIDGLWGRREDKPEQANGLPQVSLIIPAFNEEKVLQAKLENALAIDYPRERLEILVASDGSSDRTVEIASAYEDRGVRLLAFESRRGKASVVNDAVAAAHGEIICLCDANVMFRSNALRELAGRLRKEAVGAVSGDVRLASEEANFGQGEGLYYQIEKRLQLAESQVGSLMGVDGGMYAMRRSLFQPLPADTILDDFVLSMRVLQQDRRVVFEPAAVADENGTPKAWQEYRRRVRVAAGAVQSIKRAEWPPLRHVVEMWQYVSHKPLRWLGPLWLVLLLATNIFLWPAGGWFQVTLILQLVCYALAICGLLSLRFRASRLGGIPFYFALSHVAMAVGTIKGVFNLQQVTWRRAERTSAVGSSNSACQSK